MPGCLLFASIFSDVLIYCVSCSVSFSALCFPVSFGKSVFTKSIAFPGYIWYLNVMILYGMLCILFFLIREICFFVNR
jgi:hypothetical protein